MRPMSEVQHYCEINSQPWIKSNRDQLVTARGDLYVRILAALSLGQKVGHKCKFLRAKKFALVDFGSAKTYFKLEYL